MLSAYHMDGFFGKLEEDLRKILPNNYSIDCYNLLFASAIELKVEGRGIIIECFGVDVTFHETIRCDGHHVKVRSLRSPIELDWLDDDIRLLFILSMDTYMKKVA